MNFEPPKSALVSAIAGAYMVVGVAQADETIKCATRTDLTGPCYEVHGRLNAWNGNPTVRIWIIGTHHMLGLSTPYVASDPANYGAEIVPKVIIDQEHSFYTRIFADFTVCPFNKDAPGEMSSVFVESAKNIRIEKHEDVDGKDQVTVTHIPDTGPHPILTSSAEGD